MLGFISVFIVPLIGVYWLFYLKNQKMDFKEIAIHYPVFLVANNFIIACILNFVYKNPSLVLSSSTFGNSFAVKYIFISIVLDFILPFIFIYFARNLRISQKESYSDEA